MKTLAQFNARYDVLLAMLDVLINIWGESVSEIDVDDDEQIENIKNEMGEEISGDPLFIEDLKFLIFLHKKGLIKIILSGSYMSENRIGGDDVIEHVDNALEAISDGWTLKTDYVDGTAWVLGFKDEE